MFEGMLAKKYINAQKRHSALTICSIAIALALITMLFTLFSTGINVLRNIAYSNGEYHIKIVGTNNGYALNKAEYDAIEQAASEYGTCTPEPLWVSGERVYYANIMLNKRIDSANLVVDRIGKAAGIEERKLYYWTNDLLMTLDVMDADSAVKMSAIIAAFYVFVLFLIMMLRLIIDTAFEISSKERERQFGVLQSIGATPKQIVRVITYEGLMLSVIGIPIGTVFGIGLGYLVYRGVLGTGLADLFLSPAMAGELVHFSVNPWLLVLGIVTGVVWVFLSAYGTGMRVIKMSPVQAISQRANTVKKVGKAPLFGKLFGWTGKIASRNNFRQPKRFISTVVSLTLSIALFSAANVVVSDMRKAADDHYSETVGSDFFVYGSFDDPLRAVECMEKIEDCGLFEDISYSLTLYGTFDMEEDHRWHVNIRYVNRKYFESWVRGSEMSYDELAKSGGYIINSYFADQLDSEKNVTVTLSKIEAITYTDEEYNALSPEEQRKFTSHSAINGEKFHGYYPEYTVDFEISGVVADDNDYGLNLTATIDQFKSGEYLRFSSWLHPSDYINCELLDPNDYYKAKDFFEENSIPYEDSSAEHRRTLAVLASVNIVSTFLSIMIALIAVVNMINILATSILNRRGELAAMQCVGMTEKELYKMSGIECLQYALTSGIAAIVVCELMMLLTQKMLNIFKIIEDLKYLGDFISFIQPLPIIGIASLCAFIIAVAASVIPLRAMRRTSLVEQIRSVE